MKSRKKTMEPRKIKGKKKRRNWENMQRCSVGSKKLWGEKNNSSKYSSLKYRNDSRNVEEKSGVTTQHSITEEDTQAWGKENSGGEIQRTETKPDLKNWTKGSRNSRSWTQKQSFKLKKKKKSKKKPLTAPGTVSEKEEKSASGFSRRRPLLLHHIIMNKSCLLFLHLIPHLLFSPLLSPSITLSAFLTYLHNPLPPFFTLFPLSPSTPNRLR